MGCFLACFCTKDKKSRKSAIKTQSRSRSHGTDGSLHQTCSPKRPATEIQTGSIPVSSIAPEELSFSSRKKVTFDLNVKSYSKISAEEDLNSGLEIESKTEIETAKAISKGNKSLALSEDNSISSTTDSYPQSHRYQNCSSSEEDNDDDDDDDYDGGEEESESEESFVSYSSVERETRICAATEGKLEIEIGPICFSPTNEKSALLIGQNARDRSQYVHSVLNPVENLSQWKALKRKEAQWIMQLKQQRKENTVSEQELEINFSSEPSFKLPKPRIRSKHQKPQYEQEISVVASLSNWLSPMETPPIGKSAKPSFESPAQNWFQSSAQTQESSPARTNSSRSHEDRPILGGLTLDEINWASPKRSPSHCVEEIPILGTVGTHWNHKKPVPNLSFQRFGLENKGIPNITSKYTEVDKQGILF